MILLADGGSTKVDWRLVEANKEIKKISTKGANPFFRTREEISEELAVGLKPALDGHRVEAVYFFGAGCASPEKNAIIRDAIADNTDAPAIEVASDLLAAARGLCGHNKGIACILGTGSNSCFYDGEQITKNVPALGYVLGDEGSGAVLGKLFLGACLKGVLTGEIKERFLEEYNLSTAEILDRVYKQPLANRFLATLSPFIARNLGEKSVYELVYGAFRDFLTRNVMQYDYKNYQTNFTGSVAYHYQQLLRTVAADLGVNVGVITSSPMEGLIEYYASAK
jgi:N-acetylglucosamine kinase-like BadF-type ATPase